MVRGSSWRVLAALARSSAAPLHNQATGKIHHRHLSSYSVEGKLQSAELLRSAEFTVAGWTSFIRDLNTGSFPQATSNYGHPLEKRRNMRHDAAYRPSVAPYNAQDAVLRITGRVFARQRDVQQSVKKMNPVARLVRRLHIDDALVQLALINKKKAARALYEVLMSGRAAARQRQLDLSQLVVDEALVLRGPYARRPPLFRAKGGVHYPRRSTCHVYVRLREVPGAAMKTVVLRPWWERRQKHHRAARKGSRNWITNRSEFAAAVDGAPAAAGA